MALTCRFVLLILLLAFIITEGSGEHALAMVTPTPQDRDARLTAPTGLVGRAGDQSVILHWDPVVDAALAGYHLYRAASNDGPFEQRSTALLPTNHFVDFEVANDHTYYYQVSAIDQEGRQSAASATLHATPAALDDTAFLDLMQQTAFDYFWYEANPENGLIRDRNTPDAPASIAAVGFGLSALTVGIDRGWISREAGRARVLTTLQFFWNSHQGPEPHASGYKGFYYHFIDMHTGERVWDCALSTIDTALLIGGVLHAAQYFTQDHAEESIIRDLAQALYHRVEWPWMQRRLGKISHGWNPEIGFLPYDWGGYNEAMILYLLAMGSPTHPVSPDAWTAWTSSYSWQEHYGHAFVVFPELFGHQYSHLWIDFRGRQDAYMRDKGIDYFENSRRATLANRAYAIDNPLGWADYGADVWGLTASDIPTGYRARGAPPMRHDDGTIAPTAPGGSFAFTPHESLAALRHMYHTYKRQLWGAYGFKDAFNPSANWFADAYLGIDQGPFVLMIENYRTGRIWDVAMQHAAIQRGLTQAGFGSIPDAVQRQSDAAKPVLEAHLSQK